MLSILIPIYNRDVTHLVMRILHQCEEAEILFEIICMDDASIPACQLKNAALGELPGVIYHELERNIGRSAIRNLLALKARYDSLIFLDCDLIIPGDTFISNYLKITEKPVVYGGRASLSQPDESLFILHWKYGEKREVIAASVRIRRPYISFMTSNFMVAKNIMLKHPFDESIREYGYEDSVFAQQLLDAGQPIFHIDNPVIHSGLIPSGKFISRTRVAVQNLVKLNMRGIRIPSKLNKLGYKIHRLRIKKVVRFVLLLFEKRMIRNLKSGNPSLLCLDLLKLLWWLVAYNEYSHDSSKD